MILQRQGPQRTCWSDRCTHFSVKTFSMSPLMMRRTSSISDLLRDFIQNTYLIWASAYSLFTWMMHFFFGCLIWWCLSVDLQMLHQHFIPGCSPCSHVVLIFNVSLDSICKYFLRIFTSKSLEDTDLIISFLVMSL